MCNEKYMVVGVTSKKEVTTKEVLAYVEQDFVGGQHVQIVDKINKEAVTEPITLSHALQILENDSDGIVGELPTLVVSLGEDGKLLIMKDYMDKKGETVFDEAKKVMLDLGKKYMLLIEPSIETIDGITYSVTKMYMERNKKLVSKNKTSVESRTLMDIIANGKLAQALEEDLTHSKLSFSIRL